MLETLVGDAQVVATICLQYGDTGKGKVSDLLAEWADINARGTGANNAGHTIVYPGGECVVYNTLPVGIAYDSLGKTTVLGNGMVINPESLTAELDRLVARGGSFNHLRIDENAGVIMPWHIARDCLRDKSQTNGGIGSTGKGVGPAYADKTSRIGLTMKDISSADAVRRKLRRIREAYPEQEISDERTIEYLLPHAMKLKDHVADTSLIVHQALRSGKKLHIEGAQGTLLSINHGIPPYVTSSDCSINGTASGVGISARAVDLVLGLFKGPFMTRVGAGPFVTELGGKRSEEYCAATDPHGKPLNDKLAELNRFGISYTVQNDVVTYNPRDPKIKELMNSNDIFEQGIGIRLAAGEYGATTGRPRRIGWLDAVALKYAVQVNSPVKLVMTKPDCLAGIRHFNICHTYSNRHLGSDPHFPRTVEKQLDSTPNYNIYDGYVEIGDLTRMRDLPQSLRYAIGDISRLVGAQVKMVSIGPKRDQIIFD